MVKVLEIKKSPKSVLSESRQKVTHFINEKLGSKLLGALISETAPGTEVIGLHYHEKKESIYIIIEGSAKAILNGVEYTLKPGMVVFLSPYDKHGVINTGDVPFRMIEVYSPSDPEADFIKVEVGK